DHGAEDPDRRRRARVVSVRLASKPDRPARDAIPQRSRGPPVAVAELRRPRTGEPVVETASGLLRGRRISTGHVYRGIRYARAPGGVRRFTAPERVVPWAGGRDAIAPGPDCPQFRARALGGPLAPFLSSAPTGDDMLSLNVWTPAADAGRRPVM